MNCFAYHQRTKASKYHQLLDKDNMDSHTKSKDSAVCHEICQSHKNKVIKFFCTNHEFLGCKDCIALNHRKCQIDHIEDKCAGIGDSEEYKTTLIELGQKIKAVDAVIKKATLQDKEVDSTYDHVIKEIVKFRKEINDRLDQLQKQILADAEKKKPEDKETVKKVLERCTDLSSDIKNFKSKLQENKTSQQDGQLYIMIKQAKSKLNMDDLKNAEECLEQSDTLCTFERNKELENILTTHNAFGMLKPFATPMTPGKKSVSVKLTDKGEINIKTQSDRYGCQITDCAELSSTKLLLADYNNCKLKVVDTQIKAVVEEKALNSAPWCIAVLPEDKIAVTVPDKKKILVMAIAGKFSIIRRIPVKGDCRGITYRQDHLYVLCLGSKCVLTVDTHGKVKNIISLKNEIFVNPYYVLLSEDARYFYISNQGSESVVVVTLQGDISAVYKHKDLSAPLGMMMLDDGSLLVCCYCNNTIHHTSGDLNEGQTILDSGLQNPWAIYYNHQDQEVYIGGYCNQLKIRKVASTV